MESSQKPVSRREFARRAAYGAASASLLPLNELVPGSLTAAATSAARDSAQTSPAGANLPAQSQIEAEARWKAILEQYSDRFTESQKADLKRLCFFVQPALDKVRAYKVANSTLPGLYLKPLVERDKKPAPATGQKKAAAASAGKS